jgi:hypothetical protein
MSDVEVPAGFVLSHSCKRNCFGSGFKLLVVPWKSLVFLGLTANSSTPIYGILSVCPCV